MKKFAKTKTKWGWSGCCLWLLLSLGCSWPGNKVRIEKIAASAQLVPKRQILYIDFRQAVENLDFSAFRAQDLNDHQRLLISGLRQLLAGDVIEAEKIFRELIAISPAGLIRQYATDVLFQLLIFQAQWKKLQAWQDLEDVQPAAAENSLLPFKELSQAGSEYYSFPEQPVILPLEFSPSGTPLIPLSINGRNEKFWLDSGAAFSVLASDLAKKLHIVPVNQNKTGAVTGTSKKILVRMTIVADIKIGALEIVNHPAMIVPKKDLHFKIPGFFNTAKISKIITVSGILGMNAIKNLNVRIDFKNKKIIIAKPENKRSAERNLFWLGYPIVICRSMEGVPLYFLLDTGAKKSILSSSIFTKLSLLPAYRTRMKVWSAGGEVKMNALCLPSLKIEMAGHMVSFKDIIALPPNLFGLVRLDGILGIDFISGCGDLTIDLQNGVLALNNEHLENTRSY